MSQPLSHLLDVGMAADAAAASGSTVAPYALLRMATLPYRCLEALRLPETDLLLERILAAESAMEQLRPGLEDALFALVARLDADQVTLRRTVLKARRQLHAGAALPSQQLDSVEQCMAGDERKQFARWRAVQAQYDCALSQAALSFEREMQTILRPALRAPLGNPLFQGAVALASGGVALSAAREKRLPTKPDPDNLERSLFAYLMRAAAKTSPFSTFMGLSAVAVDLTRDWTPPTVDRPTVQRRVRLNRGLVTRMARAVNDIAVANNRIALCLNATLTDLGANRYRALSERELTSFGRPWREQRRAQFQLHPTVGLALLNGPAAAMRADWRQHMVGAGIGEAQVDGLLDKLIDRGLLKAPLLTDTFDPQPEQALLRLIETVDIPALAGPAAGIRRMSALCQQLAEDDGAGRVPVLEQLRALEEQVVAELNIPPQPPFQNLVLEDCWTAGVEGRLGSKLMAPLSELQAHLATNVEFSPEYLRLVDYFVSEFGVGGECARLSEFFTDAAHRLVDVVEYGNAALRPVSRPAPGNTRLGVIAHVDIADDGDGNPLMIVNRLHNGLGWLAARFAFGEAQGQQFLRESMRKWLKQAHAPCEPVDFIINGDCNDLQSHPRLTERVLQWHGEPVVGMAQEVVLHPDTLALRHNPGSGLLELFDGNGKPIQLVYLGSLFPTPAWGVPYSLLILTQPFRLKLPEPGPPNDSSSEDVVFSGRHQVGQLVLSRATWWMRSDYLSRTWFGEQGVTRLLEVERERQRLGMPMQMFAQASAGKGLASDASLKAVNGDRKPLWIDTRVPFCLSMLHRIAQRNTWIAFTEMLPGPHEQWLTVKNERHVSEIQIELVARASDPAGPATES